MRARAALSVLFAAAAPGLAAAQAVSERPDKVAVVLYQDHTPDGSYSDPEYYGGGDSDVALVSETRTLDLPAGRSRIVFHNVADGIVPQTAALEGLNGRVVERNFDYEALGPRALIDKSIGQEVRLVRTDPKTGQVSESRVTLRSGPVGIVVQHADGSTETLGCSGFPEKLVFDRIPPGLEPNPTLSAIVEAPRPGRYTVKLGYLVSGLRWSADYVARLNPDGKTLDLQGWLTLDNLTQTTFANAPTQVVAGRLARVVDDDQPFYGQNGEAPRKCWPDPVWPTPEPPRRDIVSYSPMAVFRDSKVAEVVVTGSRVRTSDLGDYKLYTLEEPTTLAAAQNKQVAFLNQVSAHYQRVYAYRAQPAYEADPLPLDPDQDDALPLAYPERIEPAPILLRMRNKVAEGLGKPLPGGIVTVYEPGPGGQPFLAGQAHIGDTPVGLPLELTPSRSNVVTIAVNQGELTHFKRADQELLRSEVTLTVRNAGAQSAPVEIRLDQAHFKLLSESRPHARDGGLALWTLEVPAQGETTLRYRVEQR